MKHNIRLDNFPFKEESSQIIGLGIEIHKQLGSGFAEIVYKDAFEYELTLKQIKREREKKYSVRYKEQILKHSFFADFVVFDDIILEIKAKEEIAPEDYAQTINYLRCSECELGLIINFGKSKLDVRRVLF